MGVLWGVQIPALVRQAKVSGVARYIGRGLNRWSNVHIADVAAIYVLAMARAPAGSFMYVESGEEALGEIVRAIAAQLGLGPAQSISSEEAIGSGAGTWRYSPSAPTAAYAATPRLISVGARPSLNHKMDRERSYLTRTADQPDATSTTLSKHE